MISILIAGLIALSPPILSPGCNSVGVASDKVVEPIIMLVQQQPEPEKEEKKDEPDYSGTEDPHGPDPHDEIHDSSLPANSPDTYYD